MSKKTIIIERTGVPSTETNISEIETNRLGSGSATWIPQSDVDCGAITITRNGTYKASATDYYAFSKAIVKSSGKAYGKKDGKKYIVKTDGQGYLIYVEVPDKMSVISPPNKTVYTYGENLVLTGLRVVAQYADGSVYRELSISELEVYPIKATESKISVFWTYEDDGEEEFVLETSFNITINN